MEKKQSSIEQKAFKSSLDYLLYYLPSAIRGQFKEQIEKAKAIHKEEVTKAFDEGQECEYQVHINSAPKYDSETYYNETFGGNNE